MALRKAQPGDEPELLALTETDPFFNLFLISNLLDGLTAEREGWRVGSDGLLLRRQANWMIHPGSRPTTADFAAAAAIVDSFAPEQVRGLTGRPEGVEPLFAALQGHPGKLHHQYFAALQTEPNTVAYTGTPRPATPADLDQTAAIYADAGEMTRSREAVAAMPKLWVVEARGEVRCVGAIHAETPQAGMIGAVFTPPRFRGQGYASTLVHAISGDLLNRGKHPCLFFHNPAAGRIYHRLGFADLGPFAMVSFSV